MARVWTWFVLLLLVAGGAQAQSASVSGTVVDETGGVVPGATVLLAGPGVNSSTTSGAVGEYRFRGVAPGHYEVRASLAGFSEGRADVDVASADVAAPAITLAVARGNEVVVVSASRLESSLINAPATMSVITADDIRTLPAQNYGDLLRPVPGLNVIQMSARDVNITSRQATSTLSNSQLTLVDGRSVYLDFFGLVLWDFVPDNPADIRQIEVIRGPASAVWGANALTGVVNIITKSPREAPGTTVNFSAGLFGRNTDAVGGRSAGSLYGANASTSHVVNNRWSYRVSAGDFHSDPYARPTGRIPLITDPRDPSSTVGGALYPADADGVGAFRNTGTSQPKFDVRVDQEIDGGRITYAGGVAGTSGTIHSGIGPFNIESGSYMGYGRVGYTHGATTLAAFVNFVDAQGPNLLLSDPTTSKPLELTFTTTTIDVSAGHAVPIGTRQLVSVGGNARRNNFDITLAPLAANRNELGAYAQDEIFVNRWRFALGARVDKSGNLSTPVFSPRLSATFKPAPEHAIRFSYNRAFRSPSTINNYLDVNILVPANLSALAPLLPPSLQPLVAQPFPLVVKGVGSELPIGTMDQAELDKETLTAYEVAYTGNIGERTIVGAAFYVNDLHNSINFTQLPPALDPYTAANPPPGWALPPSILTVLAASGVYLPHTAFTYLNLGPLREKGLELSVNQRIRDGINAYANYSWQAKPTILDNPDPYPTAELALPPTNRFNAGFSYDDARVLGSAAVSYSGQAFWSDVLTTPYFGYSDAYTLVNGSFGVKWDRGRVTTVVKVNNLLDQQIQQHVFGDILKRSGTFEVRLQF